MMPPEASAIAGGVLKTAAGSSISSGVWTLVGIAVFAFTTVTVAIVRQWGPWKQVATTEREADFARLRDEIASIKSDAKEAREEARRVSDIAQRLENMVACMRPAISILTAEVKRLDPGNPNNPALVQVQELMAMAAAGDLGLGKALVGLATVTGVKE